MTDMSSLTIEIGQGQSTLRAIDFALEQPRAQVLICPAMGMTARYYVHLGAWLKQAGYRVVIIDYQGTGATGKPAGSHATIDDWVADITCAGRWLKAADAPLVFLGHSIGSQLFGLVRDTELFDQAIFVASSTGYWRDANAPQKWINYLLLTAVLPASNLVWGYANAKFFGQGENYPRRVARQWRKWCLDPKYLEIDLNWNANHNFRNYKGKIDSLWFSDDPVANASTCAKLVALYRSAQVSLTMLHPPSLGVSSIGHTGFISRRMKDSVWPQILSKLP